MTEKMQGMALDFNRSDLKRKQHSNYIKEKRILIVDDHISDILPLKVLFEYHNCAVSICCRGKQAVQKLAKESFDLIVIDWAMPEIDGGSTIHLVNRLLKTGRIKMGEKAKIRLVIHTGVKLQNLNIPTTESLQLIDIWQKADGNKINFKKLENLMSWIGRDI